MTAEDYEGAEKGRKREGLEAGRTVFMTSDVLSLVEGQLEYDYLDSFSFIKSVSKQMYFIRLGKQATVWS